MTRCQVQRHLLVADANLHPVGRNDVALRARGSRVLFDERPIVGTDHHPRAEAILQQLRTAVMIAVAVADDDLIRAGASPSFFSPPTTSVLRWCTHTTHR